jgi:hypothetical protein
MGFNQIFQQIEVPSTCLEIQGSTGFNPLHFVFRVLHRIKFVVNLNGLKPVYPSHAPTHYHLDCCSK